MPRRSVEFRRSAIVLSELEELSDLTRRCPRQREGRQRLDAEEARPFSFEAVPNGVTTPELAHKKKSLYTW